MKPKIVKSLYRSGKSVSLKLPATREEIKEAFALLDGVNDK